MKKYAAILILLVAAIAALFVSRDRKRFFTHEGVVWTTDYHITYEAARDLGDSIQLILGNLDMSVSPYNKASLISAINENKITRIDSHLHRLIDASRIVWRESGGAFDPTVMPLVNAWGFGYKNGTLPSRTQLDSILAFIGLDKVILHGDNLEKQDPRVMLDFSSIAKGYACDEIGRMLTRNGAVNWLVEIGGEVMASGMSSHGKPWHVSVDMPSSENNGNAAHESVLILTLDSGAVATSGNYRKWRVEEGKKLSHIVDPHTGDSRAGTLLSVTVIAPDCMQADAWATACMAMGEHKVKEMMERRSNLGVMTISADTASGNLVVWSNKPFAERIE
jgi:thiamine biosynthesis lipoprotein